MVSAGIYQCLAGEHSLIRCLTSSDDMRPSHVCCVVKLTLKRASVAMRLAVAVPGESNAGSGNRGGGQSTMAETRRGSVQGAEVSSGRWCERKEGAGPSRPAAQSVCSSGHGVAGECSATSRVPWARRRGGREWW
jgi:hypothetical protein